MPNPIPISIYYIIRWCLKHNNKKKWNTSLLYPSSCLSTYIPKTVIYYFLFLDRPLNLCLDWGTDRPSGPVWGDI